MPGVNRAVSGGRSFVSVSSATARGDVAPRIGQEPQHGVHPIVDAGELADDQLRSQSIELLADVHVEGLEDPRPAEGGGE